jgi:hypothetical protein
MSTLMLYVGIAVTFLTVWGVIMVGGYLLRGQAADPPTPSASAWIAEPSVPGDGDLI